MFKVVLVTILAQKMGMELEVTPALLPGCVYWLWQFQFATVFTLAPYSRITCTDSSTCCPNPDTTTAWCGPSVPVAQLCATCWPWQVWLASQQPGVAGVVLHSPLLSGVRVFNPRLRWWPSWADIFPNHLLIRKVDVPLLVLHGTADEVCTAAPGWAVGVDTRQQVDQPFSRNVIFRRSHRPPLAQL